MSEFVAFLYEVFAPFGAVQARRMFGGYGIYHDGVMFALVADDTLFLKADPSSAGHFESRGRGRFEYEKGGRTVQLSCYLAPEEVLDDPDAATVWARRAYAAALRANLGATPGNA